MFQEFALRRRPKQGSERGRRLAISIVLFMDEDTIEARGINPLAEGLSARIQAAESHADLLQPIGGNNNVIALVHRFNV